LAPAVGLREMELETDLRTTSDRLLRTIDQLETLENEKRTLPPDSQRFQTLASEIERLAATVFAQSHAQQQLGKEAQAATQQSGATITPIEETAQAREVHVILTEWRDAERRLASSGPGSAEHTQAASDAERLRDEYHRAYTAGSSRTD